MQGRTNEQSLNGVLTAANEAKGNQGDDALLTLKGVAGLLSVSQNTCRNWARGEKHGFPKPMKLGFCTRWRKRDVLAWLDACPKLYVDSAADSRGRGCAFRKRTTLKA